MTAQPWVWWDNWTTGSVAASSHRAAILSATQHLRHVRLSGTVTFGIYPTNVIGDNGILIGVTAVFPDAAPPAPSLANAASWSDGWWGRPYIDAFEPIYWSGVTNQPAIRYFWHLEFDYQVSGGGSAGALYVGHQQLYIDANHVAPNFSASFQGWGYQE